MAKFKVGDRVALYTDKDNTMAGTVLRLIPESEVASRWWAKEDPSNPNIKEQWYDVCFDWHSGESVDYPEKLLRRAENGLETAIRKNRDERL